MKNSLLTQIKAALEKQDANVLYLVHLLAKKVFQGAGYRWEERNNGEMKLGLLRKTFRKKGGKTAFPKRLVLVPGFGDTPLSWISVLLFLRPVLKKSFDEVILIDFPGYAGFLSRERSFPSIDAMSTIFQDALDSLKPDTIIGHSLGAWVSAHYASLCGQGKRPHSREKDFTGPRQLILANPSGIFPTHESRKSLTDLFLTAVEGRAQSLRPKLFFREPFWFKWLLPHFLRFITREDVETFMKSFQSEHTLESLVQHIQGDVWLLCGEKDELLPPQNAQNWFSLLSPERKNQHHMVLLKNAGHSPHLENPVLVAAILGQILGGRIPHWMGKRWWDVLA